MTMGSPESLPQNLPPASSPSASPLCESCFVSDFPPSEEGSCSALGNEKQMKFMACCIKLFGPLTE